MDKARNDLAESYRVMLSLGAWKHFEQNTLSRIEQQATKSEDEIPISDLHNATAYIAEARGKRKTIEKIRSDIDYIVSGQ